MLPNLNRLSVFTAVCRHGSFTAAADALGVTKSVVSEHVTRLESELGAQLLVRTTRKLVLTPAGERMLDAAQRALEDLQARALEVREHRESLAGAIRITASMDFGTRVLAPLMVDFARLHPEISVEMIASDEQLDLVSSRIDIAIRGGWMRDSSHVAVRLGAYRQLLIAAPEYLRRAGTPEEPGELIAHRWIALTALSSPTQWIFTRERAQRSARVKGVLSANATPLVREWAVCGAGLTVLPEYLVGADIKTGRLRHVMRDWTLPERAVYAVRPASRYTPARVSALIAHLREAHRHG